MSLNTIRAILILNAKKGAAKSSAKAKGAKGIKGKGWTDEARKKAALVRKAKAKVKSKAVHGKPGKLPGPKSKVHHMTKRAQEGAKVKKAANNRDQMRKEGHNLTDYFSASRGHHDGRISTAEAGKHLSALKLKTVKSHDIGIGDTHYKTTVSGKLHDTHKKLLAGGWSNVGSSEGPGRGTKGKVSHAVYRKGKESIELTSEAGSKTSVKFGRKEKRDNRPLSQSIFGLN